MAVNLSPRPWARWNSGGVVTAAMEAVGRCSYPAGTLGPSHAVPGRGVLSTRRNLGAYWRAGPLRCDAAAALTVWADPGGHPRASGQRPQALLARTDFTS